MTDNIAETLKECHTILWQYRAELEPFWPTPTTEDALLFAFTELGEAVDAHLRSKPEYARNRDKDLSVLDELADCAMMLLTALGPEKRVVVLDATGFDLGHEWSVYIDAMAGILVWLDDPDVNSWPVESAVMVERIATHPGMDLPSRLIARLERIKAKRLPPPKVSVDDLYTVMVKGAGAHQ